MSLRLNAWIRTVFAVAYKRQIRRMRFDMAQLCDNGCGQPASATDAPP